MTKKQMAQSIVNKMIGMGHIDDLAGPATEKKLLKLNKDELEVKIVTLDAEWERIIEMELEAREAMQALSTPTLKYNWPKHLIEIAPIMERIGIQPGNMCKYLRGRMADGVELRVWFVQDFYLEQVAEGKRVPRPEARDMLRKLSDKARHSGFNTWFRPDHLAIRPRE